MSRDAGSDSIGTPNGPLPTEDARSRQGGAGPKGRLCSAKTDDQKRAGG